MDIRIAVVLVLVILIVAYLALRSYTRLGAPANCADYPAGPLRQTCARAVSACKTLGGHSAQACDAAVGACMPVVRDVHDYHHAGGDDEYAASLFNRMAPHLPDCVGAVKKVRPEDAVKALHVMGVPLSMPSQLAPFYQDRETRKHVREVAGLVPGSLEWALDFGDNIPASETFLGNKAECYADMDCGPAGYCMAEFPEDPTYGGHCAPA